MHVGNFLAFHLVHGSVVLDSLIIFIFDQAFLRFHLLGQLLVQLVMFVAVFTHSTFHVVIELLVSIVVSVNMLVHQLTFFLLVLLHF